MGECFKTFRALHFRLFKLLSSLLCFIPHSKSCGCLVASAFQRSSDLPGLDALRSSRDTFPNASESSARLYCTTPHSRSSSVLLYVHHDTPARSDPDILPRCIMIQGVLGIASCSRENEWAPAR
ncbi:hypothetical protein BDN67DRAFT_972577 [Paxillus ammoniavirescens]|nr:hypothetical protein BDN67DRAFT_972577 [Paxillus ammoniavirescens]